MIPRDQPAARRLRDLRERSGLSEAFLAAQLGSSFPGGYQRLEDPAAYRHRYLQADVVCRLLPILTGRGDPPITGQEVASLAPPRVVKTIDDIMNECDQFWQSAELRPGQALLKLNRVVTVDQFLRIMTILNETDLDEV